MGFSASSNPVLVTTASTLVAQANPGRRYASFVNDSDTVIYIALGSFASVNSGIRLNAQGGSYMIDVLNPYSGDIAAIHGGTGNKVLLVVEGGDGRA